MSDGIDLSARQREIVRDVLRPLADCIDEVRVFGSRAMGTARPVSDIDLAIIGDIDQPRLDRLWTAFDQSALAVTVDVANYRALTGSPLKRHIDAVGITLFDREGLLQREAR